MITALVKYRYTIKSSHALLDDTSVVKYQVVKVKCLTEINDMFDHIEDVKILIENAAAG